MAHAMYQSMYDDEYYAGNCMRAHHDVTCAHGGAPSGVFGEVKIDIVERVLRERCSSHWAQTHLWLLMTCRSMPEIVREPMSKVMRQVHRGQTVVKRRFLTRCEFASWNACRDRCDVADVACDVSIDV